MSLLRVRVVLLMGELDEIRARGGLGGRGFSLWALPPARALGDRIKPGGRADGLPRLVLDVHDGAGVGIDDEAHVLAGEFIRDFKARTFVGDRTVAAHQTFDAMPEQFVELRGQWP